MDDLPDDDDGQAIRRVAADGSNLDRSMEIDFMVVAPDAEAGDAIAAAARHLGYDARVVLDEEDDGASWTVYCTREIVLTYAAVVAAQEELDRVSGPFGGRSDGWGTFGNAHRN
jgi:regulator of RNase E activity RraB